MSHRRSPAPPITPRDWPRLMDAAREAFPAENPHGVFAFGIGPTTTRGHRRSQAGLNVYVRKKMPHPPEPVSPIQVRIGRKKLTLQPNVVAAGRRPLPGAGGEPELGGLFPGAPIRINGQPAVFGGVACFVGPARAPTHLLTAGHLFPPNAHGATVSAAASPGDAPFIIGRLAANLLDSLAIDAAAVELTDDGLGLLQESAWRGPQLVDSLAEPSVWNKPVVAFRPTTNDFSRSSRTMGGPLDAALESDIRGRYWVRGAIATDGTITDVGDSGTILSTGTTNQLAVGLCVGDFTLHTIAEPIGRVLQQLREKLGSLGLIPTQST